MVYPVFSLGRFRVAAAITALDLSVSGPRFVKSYFFLLFFFPSSLSLSAISPFFVLLFLRLLCLSSSNFFLPFFPTFSFFLFLYPFLFFLLILIFFFSFFLPLSAVFLSLSPDLFLLFSEPLSFSLFLFMFFFLAQISFLVSPLCQGGCYQIKKTKAEQSNQKKRLVVSTYFKHFSHLLALMPATPPHYSLKKSWGEH